MQVSVDVAAAGLTGGNSCTDDKGSTDVPSCSGDEEM
jgi:hypothetical protein